MDRLARAITQPPPFLRTLRTTGDWRVRRSLDPCLVPFLGLTKRVRLAWLMTAITGLLPMSGHTISAVVYSRHMQSRQVGFRVNGGIGSARITVTVATRNV